MADETAEIGARLTLSGRQEFTSEAKASTEALMDIAKQTAAAGEKAAKSGVKFDEMANRVKGAGVRAEQAMGAAGKRGGVQLAEGAAEGARMSERVVRRAGVEAGEGFGSSMREKAGEYWKTFAGPILGLFAAEKVKDVVSESFSLARQQQIANKQTNAVLKSTGGAAHETGESINELADHISLVSKNTKVASQSALNMLLSYSRVRNEAGKGNDVFTQTAKLGADVSARFGQSLPAAMRLLGRSIANPAKSSGALSRIIGGPLTKSQVDYIKKLQAGNHTLQAQEYILGKVRKAVGGAAAAGVTPADHLRVAWENLETKLGGDVLPMVNKLEVWMTTRLLPAAEKLGSTVARRLTPYMREFGAWIQSTGIPAVKILIGIAGQGLRVLVGWGEAIARNVLPYVVKLGNFLQRNLVPDLTKTAQWLQKQGSWLKPVAVGIITLIAAYKTYRKTVALVKSATDGYKAAQGALNRVMAMNPYARIIILIIAIAAALIYAYRHSATFRHIVQAAMHGVESAIKAVGHWGQWLWNHALHPAFNAIMDAVHFMQRNWRNFANVFLNVITGGMYGAIKFLIRHMGSIVTFFKDLPGTVKNLLVNIGNYIIAPFKTAFNWIARGWNDTIGSVGFHIPSWVPKIGGDGFNFPRMPEWRATGGPVYSGRPYVVGETGPELFYPGISGSILSNTRSVKALGEALRGPRNTERRVLTPRRVIPNNNPAARRAQPAGPNASTAPLPPVHVHVELNKKEIAKAVYDETSRRAGYTE